MKSQLKYDSLQKKKKKFATSTIEMKFKIFI